jgi:thiol-disulfide isomerase/thioredoxin
MAGKFTGNARASTYNKGIGRIIAMRKSVLPGSEAPDFTLLQRDSSTFTLSSAKGKYLMIDFWASWCHPCRQAIPHWKKIYAKYHDKGFNIVSVSDDSRWKDWTKAMDQEKMPWLQVIDEFPVKNMPAKVGSLYMTSYIPFYVLLDQDGKIVLYTDKENKIDDKLKEIFGS